MENQQSNSSIFGLQLNEISKNHLVTIAQWATLVAIISIINAVISLIQTFTARPEVIEIEGFSYSTQQSRSGSVVGAVISLIISFLINYFLYMFGKNTRKGIDNMDQGYLNTGFTNLKTYFQITGILLIIGLAFIFIALLGIAAMG